MSTASPYDKLLLLHLSNDAALKGTFLPSNDAHLSSKDNVWKFENLYLRRFHLFSCRGLRVRVLGVVFDEDCRVSIETFKNITIYFSDDFNLCSPHFSIELYFNIEEFNIGCVNNVSIFMKKR